MSGAEQVVRYAGMRLISLIQVYSSFDSRGDHVETHQTMRRCVKPWSVVCDYIASLCQAHDQSMETLMNTIQCVRMVLLLKDRTHPTLLTIPHVEVWAALVLPSKVTKKPTD